MIDVQLVPGYNHEVLPGNQHTYKGRRIVGANDYRADMTVIIPATASELRASFEENLLPEHRQPGEPYGLILFSSQLFQITLVGPASLAEAYRARPFQPTQTVVYGGWPDTYSRGWEKALPPTTWFPDGLGVLDQFQGVDGATITVFEYTVDKAQAYRDQAEQSGELVNMVTYHCDRCHTPASYDLGERYENRGPNSRYFASLKAHNHARGTDGHCKVPDGWAERVAAQALSNMRGTRVEVPTRAATCAAEEGCARVREAHAATLLLTGRGTGR